MSEKRTKFMEGTGNRLRQYRKAKNLTVAELAKKIGISQGSLSDIENEKTSPSAETLSALFGETDINILWLMSGVGEMAITPLAPAKEVIARIIKALYAKQFKADLKLGLKPEVLFSHHLSKLEKELGVPPGYLSLPSLFDPQTDLPHDLMVRLCMRHGISIDWVYTGEGEMLRSQQQIKSSVDADFLREIVSLIEAISKKENIHLTPKKKAELVALLYGELIVEPSRSSLLKGNILKLVKLVS